MSDRSADGVDRLTPGCGTIGCTEDADAVIDHPDHGRRTVCGKHVSGHQVIHYV